MDRFARVVLGYHGCLEPLATKLIGGPVPVEQWPRSENRWDWLGSGIYFWEHAPERAKRWAEEKASRVGGNAQPAVVGALIQLSECFDLTEVTNTELLGLAYEDILELYGRQGRLMPENRGGDDDRKRRELDCLVINFCLTSQRPFASVRRAFMEGRPVFPGAMIRRESHIQIAVRDARCILGLFRPNL